MRQWLLGCRHSEVSTTSYDGKVLCLECLRRVPHPWVGGLKPPRPRLDGKERRLERPLTGIERELVAQQTT